MDNYYKIDKELFFYHKKIFTYPTPINLEEERKKVLKDKHYNPQFKYKKCQPNIEQIKQKLKQLKIQQGVFGSILNKKREELINYCNLLQNIGAKEFTIYSKKLYGEPKEELIREAYRIVNLGIEDNECRRYDTASSIKKILDSLMLDYKFNWSVKIKNMTAGAYCDLSKKILYINKNKEFSENELKRLIIHEIGTHITRAEKGKRQRYLLFSYGFPNYLETEEGLATYNEKVNNLLSNIILKNYAGRVIAVNLALKSSFSVAYNELLQYFDNDAAWNLTTRAKRGLADTKMSGAFTKDYIYLRGKYLIEDFVKNGGNIKDLYIGKIGVEHLPLIKKIK